MSQKKESPLQKVAKVRDMFVPGSIPQIQLTEALDALGYKEPKATEADPLAQGQGVEL
jgi:hypothetical protein